MNIALDYDGTYTADPALWDAFIKNSLLHGHRIFCVTMRYPEEAVSMPCEIFYTSRKPKAVYMQGIGVAVNVWIDDQPFWIIHQAV